MLSFVSLGADSFLGAASALVGAGGAGFDAAFSGCASGSLGFEASSFGAAGASSFGGGGEEAAADPDKHTCPTPEKEHHGRK